MRGAVELAKDRGQRR